MSISIKRTYFYGCVRISAYKFHILVVCIVTINAKEYMHLNAPSSVMAVWEEKTQSKTVESAIKMVQIDLKSIIFKKLFSGSKILMADRELWNCRTFISTRRSYFMEVCWCCISQNVETCARSSYLLLFRISPSFWHFSTLCFNSALCVRGNSFLFFIGEVAASERTAHTGRKT